MFGRFYPHRVRSFFAESDDITRVVAAAAFVMLMIITLPTLAPRIPSIANGPVCSALFSPPGNGTQQSLLGREADTNAVTLQLSADAVFLKPGDPLVLEVRFINQTTGPIILAFVPGEAVFRFTQNESGMMFAVANSAGQALGEPFSSKAPAPIRQQFPPEMLHVLGPRQHCTQTITITSDRLAAAGLAANGQYQIKAVYRNVARGQLFPIGSALTPTPMFPDEGIWVTPPGGIQSNAIAIGIGVAPALLQ